MRRAAPALLALLAVLLLTACDPPGRKEKKVSPLPETVVGTITKEQVKLVKGDAGKGKALFAAQGCDGCHAFTPAGSKAEIGPDLDELEAHAQTADQGPLDAYTSASIENPGAYIVPGYQPGLMPAYDRLTDKQVGDLVAFLTKS